MSRIDLICCHPKWKQSIEKIASFERDRIFCKHDPAHLLDVARLAQIDNLERQLGISKELIYATALLHDIGRFQEYLDGTPHDQVSAALAPEILCNCGFSPEETHTICHAIACHRTPGTEAHPNLDGLIYRADKKSRMCLFCPARTQCNWSKEKMNLQIKI